MDYFSLMSWKPKFLYQNKMQIWSKITKQYYGLWQILCTRYCGGMEIGILGSGEASGACPHAGTLGHPREVQRNQNSAIICNWIWYTNKLTIIYLQSKLKDMECATIIYKLKQRNMVIFAFLCSPLYKIRNIFPVVCFLLSLSCFCRNTHSWMEASLEASISSQL